MNHINSMDCPCKPVFAKGDFSDIWHRQTDEEKAAAEQEFKDAHADRVRLHEQYKAEPTEENRQAALAGGHRIGRAIWWSQGQIQGEEE